MGRVNSKVLCTHEEVTLYLASSQHCTETMILLRHKQGREKERRPQQQNHHCREADGWLTTDSGGLKSAEAPKVSSTGDPSCFWGSSQA